MTKNSIIRGVFLVGFGATSYGMLATFVKLAYKEGFTTPEVTVAQSLIGIIGMLLINTFLKLKKGKEVVKASKKNIFQLILAGTSIGFTSVFYYLSLSYIPVSIAIVLLMQTVWMGVVFEIFLEKKKTSIQKIIAVLIVLLGTVLATNLIENWCFIWIGSSCIFYRNDDCS
jgi:drug/metabolite transporter (DMT)-like permease